MTVCRECNSIEQGYAFVDEDANLLKDCTEADEGAIKVCAVCHSPDIGEVDEDAGKDR